ncbi:pilus assembly protein TadG-related protein, partial [Streptomyces sp. NPDC127574]|uniref:pilus assembly protein TadG-related protein n=1 Tax=Streptomyces sp. NPDC127574 TaxID=3345401 RepID=UPI00363E98E9
MSRPRGWRRMLPSNRDRGGMELFYAGVVLIAFLFIGLVIDGGLALDAQSAADSSAQDAARDGALRSDPAQAR